jgi:hypothetical protein
VAVSWHGTLENRLLQGEEEPLFLRLPRLAGREDPILDLNLQVLRQQIE